MDGWCTLIPSYLKLCQALNLVFKPNHRIWRKCNFAESPSVLQGLLVCSGKLRKTCLSQPLHHRFTYLSDLLLLLGICYTHPLTPMLTDPPIFSAAYSWTAGAKWCSSGYHQPSLIGDQKRSVFISFLLPLDTYWQLTIAVWGQMHCKIIKKNSVSWALRHIVMY